MRGVPLVFLMLFTTGLACKSGESVPEQGAVLLNLKSTAGAPTPDELRAWVYDNTGRLWDGVRIPETGSLAVKNANKLGTILIQPGVLQGGLRIHIMALAGGARILDGVLAIASLTSDERTYDFLLDPAVLPDGDGDGVPDTIDDCPNAPNPAQGGCPSPVGFDAGPDASFIEVGLADVPSDTEPPKIDAITGSEANPDFAPPSDTTLAGADADTGEDIGRVGPDLESTTDTATDAGADVGEDLGWNPDAVLADAGVDASVDSPVDASTSTDTDGSACGEAGECSKPQGAQCSGNTECASGTCADGVCCTNACLGPCRSCNQPTAVGICQGYAGGSDPEVECSSGETCNGVGACGPTTTPSLPNGQLCSEGSQCASGFCKDGVCCDTACNSPCQTCGTGSCKSVRKADDIPECTGTMTCNNKSNCVTR
jgi:hypothetical protein